MKKNFKYKTVLSTINHRVVYIPEIDIFKPTIKSKDKFKHYLYYCRIDFYHNNLYIKTFYKIGISVNPIERLLTLSDITVCKENLLYDTPKVSLLFYTEYDSQEAAFEVEQRILTTYHNYKIIDNNKYITSGNSELFIRDILRVDTGKKFKPFKIKEPEKIIPYFGESIDNNIVSHYTYSEGRKYILSYPLNYPLNKHYLMQYLLNIPNLPLLMRGKITSLRINYSKRASFYKKSIDLVQKEVKEECNFLLKQQGIYINSPNFMNREELSLNITKSFIKSIYGN